MNVPSDKPVRLADYVSQELLTRVVKHFAEASGLSAGIIAAKTPDQEPSIPFRLTPIANARPFCSAIRSCAEGERHCMDCDVSQGKTAASTREPVTYKCNMGLVDVVAPVFVGATHAASVFAGAVRDSHASFEHAWDEYSKLLASSQRVTHAFTKDELRELFERLPHHRPRTIHAAFQTAGSLAEMISSLATRQLMLQILGGIARNAGTLDIFSGMSAYLSCVQCLLPCDTASVFLLADDGERLQSEVLRWGPCSEATISIPIGGTGLIPKAFNHRGPLLCGSRDEIVSLNNDTIDPYCELRGLNSWFAIGICFGDETLGIIEGGSARERAFSAEAISMLNLIADQAGAFLANARQRGDILRILAHSDFFDFAHALVEQIDANVMGEGCSLFLRSPGAVSACLAATTEFPQDEVGKATCSPGEGLTGWVLLTGRTIRIPRGCNTRTENLPRNYSGASWEQARDGGTADPQKGTSSSPFLAVPVHDTGGNLVGVLRVSDRLQGSFSDNDEHYLEACADCLGRIGDWMRPFPASTASARTRIFISHGHNEVVTAQVAAFIHDRLGLTPVILAQQPAEGRTVIEQLEIYSSTCSFAIVLLTGDDVTAEGDKRSRQNVVHELGFFHGKFGRKRVVLLHQAGVELFSNIEGLIRRQFDDDDVAMVFEGLRGDLEKAGILADG